MRVAAYPLSVFHFPVTWALAWLFRVSQAASTAGVMMSNPLSIVPIFVFTTSVGLMVTPGGTDSAMMHPVLLAEDPAMWSKLNLHDITIVVVGSSVVGLISGAITYVLGLRWIAAWRRDRVAYRKSGDTMDMGNG